MALMVKKILKIQLVMMVGALLFSVGCREDVDFFYDPDAEAAPEEDLEPPPPFPLRPGDVVVYPSIGGRTGSCAGDEGSCDRVIKATYTIQDVVLDEDSNRWRVDADYIYEMMVSKVSYTDISALFLSSAASFQTLEQGEAESDGATFKTDGVFTDKLKANQFPFFHWEGEAATEEGSIFTESAKSFKERILELDESANIDSQAAALKFESYFVDDRLGTEHLHLIRVDLHPMGFVCGWDERLREWTDDLSRNAASFGQQTTTIPYAVVFNNVQITRDGELYICNCESEFKPARCEMLSNRDMCLPTDPESDPVACPQHEEE